MVTWNPSRELFTHLFRWVTQCFSVAYHVRSNVSHFNFKKHVTSCFSHDYHSCDVCDHTLSLSKAWRRKEMVCVYFTCLRQIQIFPGHSWGSFHGSRMGCCPWRRCQWPLGSPPECSPVVWCTPGHWHQALICGLRHDSHAYLHIKWKLMGVWGWIS